MSDLSVRGFVWASNHLTLLPTGTSLRWINENGVAVGGFYNGGSLVYRELDGTIHTPHAAGASFISINNNNDIAGAVTSGSFSSVVVVTNGSVHKLAFPGQLSAGPVSIASDGTILGWYSASGPGPSSLPFIYRAGACNLMPIKNIPSDATNVYPQFLSSDGRMVGTYFTSAGPIRGFVSDGANFHHIDVPGAIDTFAVMLDGHGELVGSYDESDRGESGFVKRDNSFY